MTSTPSYLRRMTVDERTRSWLNEWTCARCPESAAWSQWTPEGRLGYRLCETHAAETRARLAEHGLLTTERGAHHADVQH